MCIYMYLTSLYIFYLALLIYHFVAIIGSLLLQKRTKLQECEMTLWLFMSWRSINTDRLHSHRVGWKLYIQVIKSLAHCCSYLDYLTMWCHLTLFINSPLLSGQSFTKLNNSWYPLGGPLMNCPLNNIFPSKDQPYFLFNLKEFNHRKTLEILNTDM